MSARDVIGRAIHGQTLADGGYLLVDSILEDLAEAGYAVVKLPEPDYDDALGVEWEQEAVNIVTSPKGNRFVQLQDADTRLWPWEARKRALVLLAAAAHAEAVDQ